MKSIKTKFMTLVLAGVLSASLAIGAAGIVILNSYADKSSAEIVNGTCELEAEKLDRILADTEHSVNAFSNHVLDQLSDAGEVSGEYLEYYTDELSRAALNYAKNTEGAMAVYVRFSTEFAKSPVSGVFYVKNGGTGEFEEAELTDLSLYEKDDTEHVGWYYIPLENGEPLWLKPYYNKNIDVYMISYVVPLYADGEAVGIAGMDIDFDAVGSMVSDIKVYETGKAFLTDGYTIAFHPDMGVSGFAGEAYSVSMDFGGAESSGDKLYECEFRGEKKLVAFNSLRNGMKLVIAAPKSEINAEKAMLAWIITAFAAVITAVAAVVTAFMTGRIIKPLRELDEAAERIADGDLDTEIKWHSWDEVGMLAESFRRTTSALRRNNKYIKELAYCDTMTGVKNSTAYHEAVRRINEEAKNGLRYGAAVFDVNGLKSVNDNYGHLYGDMLITAACSAVRSGFEPNTVYRIGGDEFVVILEGDEIDRYAEMMEKFRGEVESCNSLGKFDFSLSVAAGFSEYKPEYDEDFQRVFRRADDAMYENKKELKGRLREKLTC